MFGLKPDDHFNPEEIDAIPIDEVPEELRLKLLEQEPDAAQVFFVMYPPTDVFALPETVWDMNEDNVSVELMGLTDLGSVTIFGSTVTFHQRANPDVPGYGLFWYNPDNDLTAYLIQF